MMVPIEQLLNPISDSQPCGIDLSFSSELDAIANARRFDDPSLDQGEWVTELKEADWAFVVDSCADLIQNKSKDLRLAVWFAEANAKENNFQGLAEGFLLLAGLSDLYWENLHPVPEDEDQELRIGNIGWLLSRSVHLVREMPITEGIDTGFSTAAFEAARTRASNEERSNGDSPATEGVKLSEIEAARRKSSPKFYESLLADAVYCKQSLTQLEESIDERVGQDGPVFSGVKDALDDVIGVITRFAAESGVNTRNASNLAENSSHIKESQNTNANMKSDNLFNASIENRVQALKQLRHVADFFRRTEPHSPVAYLAEKAAAWGDLPLDQWLRTVIKDPSSLAHVEELLGLQQGNQND